ncbi:MAG: ATP-dependent DNA helicase RecG [Bacteroidia bacterium]
MDFWQKDITYLKKVGPQRAKALQQELGIYTYGELLHYYPRKYVDRSLVSPVGTLPGDGSFATLVGKIVKKDVAKTQKGRGRLSARFTDGTGFIELTWFRGIKWMDTKIKKGAEVAIFGKVDQYNGKLQMVHPELDFLQGDGEAANTLAIVPFYPSGEKLQRVGLDARGFRAIFRHLLEEGGNLLHEFLPAEIMRKNKLIPRDQAIRAIHFPPSFGQLQQARRRLKFDELFLFQMLLARKRGAAKASHQASPFPNVGDYFNDFYNNHLPFSLTNAQKRVIKETRRDLAQSAQMNRLIQGDVGSGKTMVAFLTMLIAKDNGFQSALMAPTEILADQHYRKLGVYAEKLGLKIALLVGGQRAKERREVLEMIASGEASIVVGTHALIEDKVVFKRLGLTVVDEQHKFGVMQRAKLWNKAQPYPHNMLMTATPIPRTLAMTLYGDVDVSVINELPPGRKPITTAWRGESKRLEVFGFIRSELEKGKQAYVVYPLVEESEKLDLLAATEGQELLQRAFPNFKVGLVHGKMKSEDKDIEMKLFLDKKADILVSTTVIEVGVDVPNATIIMIENAERFGLSQLHQLRGRVGRNADQSYCILMSGPKVSKEGKARLQAMVDTTDGFKISEFDLKLRGPGDFLGTRQSGLPEFQLANIAEDQDILADAREAAFSLHDQDPNLSLPQHQQLRAAFAIYSKKYGKLGTIA